MISFTAAVARMLLIGPKSWFDGRSSGKFNVAAPTSFKVIPGMLLLATSLCAIELTVSEGWFERILRKLV